MTTSGGAPAAQAEWPPAVRPTQVSTPTAAPTTSSARNLVIQLILLFIMQLLANCTFSLSRVGHVPPCLGGATGVDAPPPAPVDQHNAEPQDDWPAYRIGQHASGIEFRKGRHRQVNARTGHRLTRRVFAGGFGNGDH